MSDLVEFPLQLSDQSVLSAQRQSFSVLDSPPREEVESLTTLKNENVQESMKVLCAICYEMIDFYESCMPNTCSHFFCLSCILKWNDVQSGLKMKCPMCCSSYTYLVQIQEHVIRHHFTITLKRGFNF